MYESLRVVFGFRPPFVSMLNWSANLQDHTSGCSDNAVYLNLHQLWLLSPLLDT